MDEIAVVGSKDVNLGFKALGVTVVDVATPEQAEQAVEDLANRGCQIILIAEALAEQIGPTLDRFQERPTPAVVMIPDHRGSRGYARERVRRLVEKAVGIDILSRESDRTVGES
ncbi:MAG: V-type ATP synthase subunit F [Candidatus Bipolaricaulia bacterium]